MPAIITDILKKDLLAELKSDFDSAASEYYIGLGRSELWDTSDTVVTPTQSSRTVNQFRHSLQGIKKTLGASYIIPRYNWTSGTTYTAYDDNTVGYPTNSYYVKTPSNQIYICLTQGKNANGAAVPSTIEPTSVATTPVTLADGYTWKYLYSIGAVPASRFLTANYMPVQFIDSADNPNQTLQKSVQDAAIAGEVSSIIVTSGGTGYSTGSPPTITVVGDGASAAATATVSGGAVVKIEMTNRGSGYTYANIVFSSGVATARPILSPTGGFGADPRNDLRSNAIMFNARPDGAESGNY